MEWPIERFKKLKRYGVVRLMEYRNYHLIKGFAQSLKDAYK